MNHEKEYWLSSGNERLVCCVSPKVRGFIADGHFLKLKYWVITYFGFCDHNVLT